MLRLLQLLLDVAVGPMIFYASLPFVIGGLLVVVIATLVILFIQKRRK